MKKEGLLQEHKFQCSSEIKSSEMEFCGMREMKIKEEKLLQVTYIHIYTPIRMRENRENEKA